MNVNDDNIFQESAQPGLLSQYNFETATFHILLRDSAYALYWRQAE